MKSQGLLWTLPAEVVSKYINQDPAPRVLIDLVPLLSPERLLDCLGMNSQIRGLPDNHELFVPVARWMVAGRTDMSDAELTALIEDDLRGFKAPRRRTTVTRALALKTMPPRVSRLLFESDVVTILSLTKTDDSHWHLLNAVVYNRYLTPEQVTSVLVYLTSGTLDDYRVGLTTEYLLQTSLERNILGEVLTEPLESFEVLNSLTKVRQSAVKSDSFEGSCVPGPWLLRTLTGLETKPDATCNLLDHVERVYHQEILALLPVKTENLYHVNACETCQCSPFARKAVEATSSYGLSHYAGWAQDVAVELLNEACGGNLTFWVVATSRVADGGHDPLGELLGGIEGAVKPSPKSGS